MQLKQQGGSGSDLANGFGNLIASVTEETRVANAAAAINVNFIFFLLWIFLKNLKISTLSLSRVLGMGGEVFLDFFSQC